MERKRKLLLAKSAVALGAVPVLLWAYQYGPYAGFAGVPGENGTCANAECHGGTANSPANKGSVSITFPNGQTYAPGVKQHLVVTVADPATTQRAWGFELTARAANNTKSQAGAFASTDNRTQVKCVDTATVNYFQEVELDFGGSQTCPSAKPLSYIEHSMAGFGATQGTGSGKYEFDWTPPASDAGNITIYVAGNAGVLPVSQKGDHIYTGTYTLTPLTATPLPTIGGVSNSAGGQPGVFPGSFISIYGTNFTSGAIDDWGKFISNGQLPTSLDGVSVTIGDKQAYVSFVSPMQINAQAPDAGFGPMTVTVHTATGTSLPFSTTSSQYAPAFFPWPGDQVVATHQDFTWAVKPGTFPGVTTVAAKPGDVIILWGTGFGPATPAWPAGQTVPTDKIYNVVPPPTVTLNKIPVTVYGAALVPTFAGEYQIAIQVPVSMPDGDWPVVATLNGLSSPSTLVLSVHH